MKLRNRRPQTGIMIVHVIHFIEAVMWAVFFIPFTDFTVGRPSQSDAWLASKNMLVNL